MCFIIVDSSTWWYSSVGRTPPSYGDCREFKSLYHHHFRDRRQFRVPPNLTECAVRWQSHMVQSGCINLTVRDNPVSPPRRIVGLPIFLSVGGSPSWLRHRILIPTCIGSNPIPPAKFDGVHSLVVKPRVVIPLSWVRFSLDTPIKPLKHCWRCNWFVTRR